MRLIELANKVLNGEELTYAEGVEIINTSDEDTMLLIALADKIRQKYHGDAVDLCSIVNARSGRCPETSLPFPRLLQCSCSDLHAPRCAGRHRFRRPESCLRRGCL